MSRSLDWRNYVNEFGDFELPNYLYQINKELMKQSLDLGTLLSDDKIKLRAYKEQVKTIFKRRWMELAQALEFFDIIVPCQCSLDEFCDICGGSRYVLNALLSPEQMREIGIVFSADADAELAEKLQAGLTKALKEIRQDYFELPEM
jgi:hypothetical protein